jgi:GNAT superfamily N-acetyltransferase
MVELTRTTVLDAAFTSLVADLDKEFWVRYPDTQQNFAPHNKVDLNTRVVVAFLNKKPVGCGCFRPMAQPDTMEIKRMYVVPEARGQRIARLILQSLEAWGREVGFSYSKLETGIKQPEAIAVYTKASYQRIPNYPPYTDCEESICMEKKL